MKEHLLNLCIPFFPFLFLQQPARMLIFRFKVMIIAVLLAINLLFTFYILFPFHRSDFLEVFSHKSHCQRQFICGQFVYHIPANRAISITGDPKGCSKPLQLSCERNRSTVLYIKDAGKYYLRLRNGATQLDSTVLLLDPSLQKNNYSTFPMYQFGYSYVSNYYFRERAGQWMVAFVSCKRAVKSPRYVDTAPFLTTGNAFSSSGNTYSYVVIGKADQMVASDIEDTCTIHRSITSRFPVLDDKSNGSISFHDIHDALAGGYDFNWEESRRSTIATFLWGEFETLLIYSVMPIVARSTLGIMLLFTFLMYKCKRRHLSVYDSIEDFLQSRNNMAPIRYSYKQIKKMTNNFKDKLGEGGYGIVYKGKLRSGQLVAVKMLTTKSKANGRDFINEVATLGRIHHVNVVRLVGFCATKTKSALIYDYMQNGSLDRYLFNHSAHNSEVMTWSNIYEIAVGVARGMDYLHQGCNMQILHFDIKPHNILLDENFVPKVSDFGLAKLRPVKNDVVTMTAVRGTLGYMAPELFYKRVGEVTYKADVYSFGMLLMEMGGRRKNVNTNAEHSSQVYFPSWIYDKIQQGRDIEFGVHDEGHFSDEEKEVSRKLILIAFWCIQMAPSERPSMKEVLQMLLGDSENLLLPPKPQFYPPDPPVVLDEQSCSSSVDGELTKSLCESVSLEIQEVE